MKSIHSAAWRIRQFAIRRWNSSLPVMKSAVFLNVCYNKAYSKKEGIPYEADIDAALPLILDDR